MIAAVSQGFLFYLLPQWDNNLFVRHWNHLVCPSFSGPLSSQSWAVLPQGFRDNPHLFRQTLAENLRDQSLEGGGLVIQYVNDLLICSPTEKLDSKNVIQTLNYLTPLISDRCQKHYRNIETNKATNTNKLNQGIQSILKPGKTMVPLVISYNLCRKDSSLFLYLP